MATIKARRRRSAGDRANAVRCDAARSTTRPGATAPSTTARPGRVGTPGRPLGAARVPVPGMGGGGQIRTDDPSIMSRVLLPTELRRPEVTSRPDPCRAPGAAALTGEPPDRIELSTFSLPW